MALKEVFIKNGFTYQLIKKIENFAIYKQKKEGFNYTYYEVIKIQVIKKDAQMKFKDAKKGETKVMTLKAGTEFYPSTNQWGSNGWTYKTMEQAENKFNDLIEAACLTK